MGSLFSGVSPRGSEIYLNFAVPTIKRARNLSTLAYICMRIDVSQA